MPQALHFGDPGAEYACLTGDAGVVDVSDRTQLQMVGADRATFLNRLATNRLAPIVKGMGYETFLTDAKGHVVAYGFVFAGAESLVLDTAPGQAAWIVDHLSRYIVRDRVELHDRSEQWAEFLLAGPEVSQRLQPIVSGPLPAERLTHGDVELAGMPVSLRCLVAAPRPVWWISCDQQGAVSVWRAILGRGFRPCGQLAAEALRIESGWPEYGRDVTRENLPQEVARDGAAISFDKGCYLGQETVARIASRGHVNKTLVGLKFATPQVPVPGSELTVAGTPAGRVTSAAFSPRFAVAVGLGYVRRGHDTPGNRLDSPAGAVEVAALPLD